MTQLDMLPSVVNCWILRPTLAGRAFTTSNFAMHHITLCYAPHHIMLCTTSHYAMRHNTLCYAPHHIMICTTSHMWFTTSCISVFLHISSIPHHTCPVPHETCHAPHHIWQCTTYTYAQRHIHICSTPHTNVLRFSQLHTLPNFPSLMVCWSESTQCNVKCWVRTTIINNLINTIFCVNQN